MKRLRYLVVLLAAVLSTTIQAKNKNASIAIVVDDATAEAVNASIDAFADQLRSEGKDVFVISLPATVDPRIIRDSLKFLHSEKSLEGALLVGDVPIPMIRRAHHLATAFKMNPAARRDRSSIPSDRFYDDFSLEFDPIDNDGPLWYYDLSPKGAQRVECDIYTARIKAETGLIAEFLDRAAAEHAKPRRQIDRVFHFAGHGNSSESFNARIDENRAYYEMFGFNDGSGRVDFINFDEDPFVRTRLQKILAMPELDIVHLHTHGGVDAQYISKEPYTFMPAQHAENLKQFLRGRMRSAKDPAKEKANIMKSYDVPESWLAGWDDPEQSAKDSLRSASVDIMLEDLDGFKSGPALIMLDACFNGAFLHKDFVAARYAFAQGSQTIAVTANSVNIIQDHWKNELIGLLAHGVSIGNWIKNIQTLESHVFGDPTYIFAYEGKSYDAQIAFPSSKSARKMLSQEDPSLCGFAIGYLHRKGELSDAQVLDYLKNDSRMNVRMEALMSIVRNPKDFKLLVETLSVGMQDSYELVRRMSARYAEICGAPELQQKIEDCYNDPLVTARVKSHLASARRLYGDAAQKSVEDIGNASLSVKERISEVRAQRNRCNPAAVKPMLEILKDSSLDSRLRSITAEALGWYVLSVERDNIYNACKALAEKESEPEVKDELIRTIARLEDNAYCR